MAISTPDELRDRIDELCRRHEWDQAEYEITARDDAIRAEEREACAKIADDRGWDRTAAEIRARASNAANVGS